MSTRFTQAGMPMIESSSLQLIQVAAQVHESSSLFLSKSLKNMGYKSASLSVLNFLSTLECGVNYGSEIARTLGVSRQMVAKTVKELCEAGYLDKRSGLGKQKEIVFTEIGELLMSDARQLLADLDETISKDVEKTQLAATLNCLQSVQNVISNL